MMNDDDIHVDVCGDAKPDWDAIRAEYIGGGTSYRKLAKKYAVGLTTIAVRASEEGWTRDRQIAKEESREMAIRKTADQATENSVKLEYARSLMIDRVLQALEQMPDGVGNHVRQSQKDSKTGKQMTVDYDILKLVAALEKLSNVSAGNLARQVDLMDKHADSSQDDDTDDASVQQ